MPCAASDMLPRYDTSLLAPWLRKVAARPPVVPEIGAAILCRIVERHDAEFADRVHRWQQADAAGGELVVVDAVIKPVVRVFAHALCGQRHAAAVRHFAAGALVEEGGGAAARGA